MEPTGSEEFTNEFWKDIPDEILEELYKQLDVEGDEKMMMDEQEEKYNNSNEDYGDVPQSPNLGQLPPLFQTPSMTNVTNLKPAMSNSTIINLYPQPLVRHESELNHARSIINQISQLENQQQVQIENMRQLQKQSAQSQNKEGYIQLQQQQQQILQHIDMELKELNTINSTIILEPSELSASRAIAQRLLIQQQTLDLFRRELLQLSTQAVNPEPLALLLIEDQPVPQVLFKGKPFEDTYNIRLITAPNFEVQSITKVQASLVSEERAWKSDKPMDNCEVTMDLNQKTCTFSNLKVNVSTRVSMVHFRFTASIIHKHGRSVIQSPLSYPVIVITNESQWCEAEGKLILLDTFGRKMDASWQQLANTIHHHFLKASRQETAKTPRSIKYHEFEYIHQKFFGSAERVTSQQASTFWVWFGQATQSLRFKRHIRNLWFEGLIYGFITKAETNLALSNQEEGTFLIRFSETCPGLFAIGYVSDDPSEYVKHYLVKPEDTGSQKTLPDFLREKPQFKYLLKLDPNTGLLYKSSKDTLLKLYYSKGKRYNSGENGYVLL